MDPENVDEAKKLKQQRAQKLKQKVQKARELTKAQCQTAIADQRAARKLKAEANKAAQAQVKSKKSKKRMLSNSFLMRAATARKKHRKVRDTPQKVEEEHQDVEAVLAVDSQAAAHVAPPLAVEPDTQGKGSAVGGARASSRKVHSGFRDLLVPLMPPGAQMFMSTGDQRFVAEFPPSGQEGISLGLIGSNAKFNQETFSRTFANIRSWQAAAGLVHDWAWGKWVALPAHYRQQCVSGQQQPGVISQAHLAVVQSLVSTVPQVPAKNRSSIKVCTYWVFVF